MILALDVGNSQIHGGVFFSDQSAKIEFQFRKNTKNGYSSDEIGLFLRAVLRENGAEPSRIKHIAICSVVPDVVHSIRSACIKYFDLQPFMLEPGVKTGLKNLYSNPLEVGADRIANAIAGAQLFPGKNLIIVDYGTATTFDVITAAQDYLGGLIVPGLRISMEALELRTAKLPSVEILTPGELVGRSTVESIQSGLYYSNYYALLGITAHIKKEYFENAAPAMVIGTGGFCRLFDRDNAFDAVVSELVLIGLFKAFRMNQEA